MDNITCLPQERWDTRVYASLRMDCANKQCPRTLGTWWWTLQDIAAPIGLTYLEFLQDQGVHEIYLHMEWYEEDGVSLQQIRDFVRRADRMGMRVSMLGGWCAFAFPGDTGFARFMSVYNTYQSSAGKGEKLAGIHLDVEPHTCEGFEADRANRLQQFADFVALIADPAARAAGTKLAFDIPYYFSLTADMVYDNSASPPIPMTLGELVSRHSDEVTLMAYFNHVPSIIEAASNLLGYLAPYNKKITVAVETGFPYPDHVAPQESFGSPGQGRIKLDAAMRTVGRWLDAHYPSGCGGMAVHYVEPWFDLAEVVV